MFCLMVTVISIKRIVMFCLMVTVKRIKRIVMFNNRIYNDKKNCCLTVAVIRVMMFNGFVTFLIFVYLFMNSVIFVFTF